MVLRAMLSAILADNFLLSEETLSSGDHPSEARFDEGHLLFCRTLGNRKGPQGKLRARN
jgi:hypothetical protein